VTALIEQPTVRLLCAGLAPTAPTSQGGNP
jgi:hypothetical protein